jgi:hypothetical protein
LGRELVDLDKIAAIATEELELEVVGNAAAVLEA